MIDDIVRMVLREARERDKDNLFSALDGIVEEINDKATSILLKDETQEGRQE